MFSKIILHSFQNFLFLSANVGHEIVEDFNKTTFL